MLKGILDVRDLEDPSMPLLGTPNPQFLRHVANALIPVQSARSRSGVSWPTTSSWSACPAPSACF
jgi:hypothetical protein